MPIVRNWKDFISGAFQIFRYLKGHTIFIGENSCGYAVLSMYEPFQDVVHGHPTPINVEAVLRPFKGRIVYDGMLKMYPIFLEKTLGPN